MNLTVIISQECNLRCTFCQVDKGVKTKLSDQQIDQIKAWAQTREIDNLILFGGEPLLFLDQVKRLYGIRCKQFVILTNGSMMNDEAVEFISAHPDIYVTVAIDGTPEVHARQRGVFNVKLDRIRALPNPVGVDFALTRSNLPHFAESIAWLHGLGFDAFYINVVREDPYSDQEIALFERQTRRLSDFLHDKPIKFNLFDDFRPPGKLFCHLGHDDLSIGPDGKVYLCYAFASFPEARKNPESAPDLDRLPGYGIESTPIVLGESIDDFKMAPLTYREQCLTCPSMPYCVMCPASHYYSHGNMNAVPEWFCQLMHTKARVQKDYLARRSAFFGTPNPLDLPAAESCNACRQMA